MKEDLPDFLKAGGADVSLSAAQDGALAMETYGLSLTLMQLSAEAFGGSWQVYSQDGELYFTRSLDLNAQK